MSQVALSRRSVSRVLALWGSRLIAGIGQLNKTPGAAFGLGLLSVVVIVAIGANWIAPYDPNEQNYTALRQAPSWAHPLGTDNIGRDVLSRIFHGARISLSAGLISVGLAMAVGVPLGLVSGYLRGWVDALIMRVVDALWSFPTLILALSITALLGPSLRNVMIAVGIVFTPIFGRLARGETLSVREREFVTAARSIGASSGRIIWSHIVPNIITSIIIVGSLLVGLAIIAESSLSFLGVGVRPPTPSWGADLRDGSRILRQAWWVSVFPGLAIFMTVLAANLVGDGVRRALDPRLRRIRGI